MSYIHSAGDPVAWSQTLLKRTAAILFTLLGATSVHAATWYVDNAATGRNTGTSWADAWTSLNAIKGVSGGDTVYVSGGATSKVYNMGSWTPPSGNSSAQFTLRIGQDSGHNGTAIFRNNAGAIAWLGFCHYATINGRYNNQNRFRVENYGLVAYMDADGRTGATGVKLLGITTSNGSIRMYDSRKTELGWIVFEPHKRSGGPGCIQGVGRGDQTGWGNNSIHDCEFNLFYLHGVDKNGDNGDDGIQNVGAIDIYNNKFISRKTTGFAGANHQDAIQTDGRYIRIFNNYFENIANYAVFGEYWGNFVDLRIYNNVFNYSDSVLTSQPSASIAIGARNNGRGSDIIVANNSIRGSNRAIAIGGGSDRDSYVNTHIVNNIVYAGGGIIGKAGPGGNITISHNAQISGNSPSPFVNLDGGDFHLASNSSGCINAGTSFPSPYFDNDKDGGRRPNGSAWDIGAYEHGSTSSPPPSPTPTPREVPTPTPTPTPSPGPTASPTPPPQGTAFEAESGTLKAPFAVENGNVSQSRETSLSDGGHASYPLSINAPGDYLIQVVVNAPNDASNSLYVNVDAEPTDPAMVWDIPVTSGFQQRTVSGRGSGTPTNNEFTPKVFTLSSGPHQLIVRGREANVRFDRLLVIKDPRTFEAESGQLSAPFVVENGSVSQSRDTNLSDGGRASYPLSISDAGDYVINVLVEASNDASNSLYVNVDAEPTDPTMIWDIPATSSFEQRTVSWRGKGTPGSNEFVPKVFTLTAGSHQLIIRGREPNVRFDRISIAKASQAPAPPQSLRTTSP